jgi:hypothetical protein
MNKRTLTGVLFLFLQFLSLIYARFIPERFFCWAPYDEHSYYKIEVALGDNVLTTEQIKERYRYKVEGWEPRSINNLFNLISQYESSYGKNENAKVTIDYTINGHKKGTWNY